MTSSSSIIRSDCHPVLKIATFFLFGAQDSHTVDVTSTERGSRSRPIRRGRIIMNVQSSSTITTTTMKRWGPSLHQPWPYGGMVAAPSSTFPSSFFFSKQSMLSWFTQAWQVQSHFPPPHARMHHCSKHPSTVEAISVSVISHGSFSCLPTQTAQIHQLVITTQGEST